MVGATGEDMALKQLLVSQVASKDTDYAAYLAMFLGIPSRCVPYNIRQSIEEGYASRSRGASLGFDDRPFDHSFGRGGAKDEAEVNALLKELSQKENDENSATDFFQLPLSQKEVIFVDDRPAFLQLIEYLSSCEPEVIS